MSSRILLPDADAAVQLLRGRQAHLARMAMGDGEGAEP